MKTRSDNRRALPKFFLTILGAGLFGGVLGFAAGFLNVGNLADSVRQAQCGPDRLHPLGHPGDEPDRSGHWLGAVRQGEKPLQELGRRG